MKDNPPIWDNAINVYLESYRSARDRAYEAVQKSYDSAKINASELSRTSELDKNSEKEEKQ